jgi:hypothetical protein
MRTTALAGQLRGFRHRYYLRTALFERLEDYLSALAKKPEVLRGRSVVLLRNQFYHGLHDGPR